MRFVDLRQEDCERARVWRNQNLAVLRTPYMLTEEQQETFYREVVCNRQSNARFWGIWIETDIIIRNIPIKSGRFIGMAGLVNIGWENRNAEISVIIDPVYQENEETQEEIFQGLLRQGFYHLNLENIYAECYTCSPYYDFWLRIAGEYEASKAKLPQRKFWNDQYWDSLYINFNKGAFYENSIIKSKSASGRAIG